MVTGLRNADEGLSSGNEVNGGETLVKFRFCSSRTVLFPQIL